MKQEDFIKHCLRGREGKRRERKGEEWRRGCKEVPGEREVPMYVHVCVVYPCSTGALFSVKS